MPMEAKNLVIYITIAVVLLLIALVVFTAQTQDIWKGFLKSIEQQPEDEINTEERAEMPTYMSSDVSMAENLKSVLTNFDPQSKLVYCKIPADYYDSDENDVYVMLCDPMIFDVPESQKDLANYDYLYTNVFSEAITNSWSPKTFSGLSIAPGGPTYIKISPDTLNYEGGCWESSVETTVFGSGKDRIFVEQDTAVGAKAPSERKIMVRIAFNVSEPDKTFNPAVSVCPNIIR